jgi:tetratricopeptide (TPR) repeat protein
VTDFRYKAFVSYSWADAEWGKWLLHSIETYRTPAALVGKDGAHGPVPARLHPLFKDREEEAAGASIGQAVETALAGSEFLIVICSPRSAQSQWVNREVAWFKTHRDPNNILALIVDGEPGGGDTECFPQALTHQVDPDMTVTAIAVDAPLAADARMSGDGKRKARLKLAAAMLGVGLDELVNRDERRRTVRTRLVVGASLSLALVMSGMAWAQVQARREADHQRAESDGLVEFMLTDLRAKLEPVGRLDALDVVGQRALKYYAGQKASSLDADALGRRARALHLVGEVANIRGDSVGGLNAFRQAAATTAEQLARDPDNPQRIFDHAQSVFWVGYVAYNRGELQEAEAEWREYQRLADRLVALEPNKPAWWMEQTYAQSNLGTLFYAQGREQEAIIAFSRALGEVQRVAKAEGNPDARQLEVGQAFYWLASAQAELHQTNSALDLHRREIALYQRILSHDPGNTSAKRQMAVAWQMTGRLELISGDASGSISANATALEQIRALRRVEPANTEWEESEVRTLIGAAEGLFNIGQMRDALRMQDQAADLLQRMIATDPSNTQWNVDLRNDLETQQAQFRLAAGDPQAARDLAQSVNARLRTDHGLGRLERAKLIGKVELILGDALLRLGDAARSKAAWQTGLGALADIGGNRSSLVQRTRYTLLERLGRSDDARVVAAQMKADGDRHPAWLRLLGS